jgi:methylated-DNA-protein-cysteine methyltransferase-like protein
VAGKSICCTSGENVVLIPIRRHPMQNTAAGFEDKFASAETCIGDRDEGSGVQMTERTRFNQRVYQIVEGIPPGQVLTYGRIAAFIPPPPGMPYDSYCAVRARWVGYAMASCPEGLPWHRVVNAQGQVSKRPGFGPDLQRQLLEDESIVFDEKGRLDIQRYVWQPDAAWLQSRGLLPPARE